MNFEKARSVFSHLKFSVQKKGKGGRVTYSCDYCHKFFGSWVSETAKYRMGKDGKCPHCEQQLVIPKHSGFWEIK